MLNKELNKIVEFIIDYTSASVASPESLCWKYDWNFFLGNIYITEMVFPKADTAPITVTSVPLSPKVSEPTFMFTLRDCDFRRFHYD